MADLESAPATSRGGQRLRLRLQHLVARFPNLENQVVAAEAKTAVGLLTSSAAAALQMGKVASLQTSATTSQLPAAGPEVGQAPVVSSAAFSGMVAAQYHKLPDPLTSIMQQLLMADGLDEAKLLEFVLHLFQPSDFSGVSNERMLELIYPYCRGAMTELVTRVIREVGSLDAFLSGVLESFIADRLRDQLRQKPVP